MNQSDRLIHANAKISSREFDPFRAYLKSIGLTYTAWLKQMIRVYMNDKDETGRIRKNTVRVK